MHVDHFCDAEQAVVAAQKLVDAQVDFVVGLDCSSAAIASSSILADAGIPLMTTAATNPLLTEQGFANVFRFCGRDDDQGAMAGQYLAENWNGTKIAIAHDGDVYGKGLAEETRKALRARGVMEVLYQEITPGRLNYSHLIDQLEAVGADALYYAGYPAEAGLIIRQAHDRGDDLQLFGGDALHSDAFRLIAGDAGDRTHFTMFLDARTLPAAADVVAEFRADGPDPGSIAFLTYGALEAWAQAVEQAGTEDPQAVIETLHTGTFETIFGRIGFNEKGDVTGYEPFAWYVWRGGSYQPVNTLN